MIELIFVIIIIGILASVALPRIWVTRDDAIITKARTQVAAIRSSINNAYSKRLLSGSMICPNLERNDNNFLFENILDYPIKANQKEINWTLDGNSSLETNYTIKIGTLQTTFIYDKNTTNNCKFDCNHSQSLCQKLTE